MAAYFNAFEEAGRLVLLSRDADGKVQVTKQPAEYSAFYKVADLGPEMLRNLRTAKSVRSVVDEANGYVRVIYRDRFVRKMMVSGSRERSSPLAGIPVFEGDVHPVRRFFSDTDATIQVPRVAYIDLETDSRVPFSKKESTTVLSWAIVDADGNEFGDVLAGEEIDPREESALLERFFELLGNYDLVMAWHGDGFDFPILEARSVFHRLNVPLQRWLWLDAKTLYQRMNTSSESGDEKASMKLNDVASKLLKEGKDEFDASKTYESWKQGGAERERLLRYNMQDTRLLQRIEAKTGFLALFQTICEVCRVFPESRSLGPTVQMDGYMLRLGNEGGIRFPTKEYRERTGPKFKGAYVMAPETNGIEKLVHVADFASLYPSIILTWNSSPETLVDAPVNGPIPEGVARSAKTGTSYRVTEDGVLPTAVRGMIQMRKYWGDLKASLPPGTPEWKDADRKSTAYKVAVNSFYGVLGEMSSRFYNRKIAESVTQNGVWLLQETMAAAVSKGMRVVYGDTDSLFVTGVSEVEFGQFVAWCNSDLYPELLAKQGCAHRNAIKLAYEKAFERVVFTSAKKYAGNFAHYKGVRAKAGAAPEIRGLEYKRGDSTVLARKLQSDVINLILAGEEREHVYRDVVERSMLHVLQEPLDISEIVITKSLRRETADYSSKTKKDGTPAADIVHLAVAKVLQARGEEVAEGTRIAYVIAKEGPPLVGIPAADYDGSNVDRYYAWESVVYPPTFRLLQAAFPSGPWNEFEKRRPKAPKAPKKSKDQKTLSIFETRPVASELVAEYEQWWEENAFIWLEN